MMYILYLYRKINFLKKDLFRMLKYIFLLVRKSKRSDGCNDYSWEMAEVWSSIVDPIQLEIGFLKSI